MYSILRYLLFIIGENERQLCLSFYFNILLYKKNLNIFYSTSKPHVFFRIS